MQHNRNRSAEQQFIVRQLLTPHSLKLALLNEQWISWPEELSKILSSALLVVPNTVTSQEILSNKEWLGAV